MAERWKVGYDAKRLFHNHSGLGNYSRTLLTGMSQYVPEIDTVLYSPSAQKSRYYEEFCAGHKIRSRAGIGASIWRSFTQASDWRSDGLTHYHGLSHELPWFATQSRVKKIVTIHDLIQLRYPEDHRPHDRWIYTQKIKRALDIADRVICISRSTQDDVQSYFNIDPSRLAVVYQSCDERYHAPRDPNKVSSLKAKYNLPSEYILFLSGARPRKNVLGVLRAYELLGSDRPPLLLLGSRHDYEHRITSLDLAPATLEGIHFAHVLNEELPYIYDGALLYLYPSHYEGFGIPILEAFARQVPVITSACSSMPEAAGDAAILVDPGSDVDIAEGMRRILGDSTLARSMVERGTQQLKGFTLERSVAKTVRVYREC